MKYKIMFFAAIMAVTVSCKSQKNMGSNTQQNNPPASHDLSMYPKETNALKRHIISLPKKTDESNYKVELYVGKIMEIDCNKSTLVGEFTEETVFGWGYTFFNFKTDDHIMSTKKACPEGTNHDAFVSALGKLVRYNSKLPIVIYTPEGYEVRYKIWSRSDTEMVAEHR
ncbi:serine protease inhibitor ecotin [Tamlana fucoidanivorans]|uniref:Serine protease inhibitor ecotin n=1 Tax=Allotamlana fucoidanivorans TaxID=2583814 RepID=A0A5C4SLL7_9FLAO|nr:serine protease inhibitor ecotin [Tamlana fucoidanivorans]TNJ44572.1 serine protease inhibitor ecotin [Tamlana fucoidanivorans]